MTLQVHLSSAHGKKAAALVSLEGAGINVTVPFPPPGRVASFQFDLPGTVIDHLSIAFRVGAEALPLVIEKLPTDSSMSLLALPNEAFMGSVYHSETSTGCVVRCADGTERLTCAVCKRGRITARVCC
jgi:hypothetical protein